MRYASLVLVGLFFLGCGDDDENSGSNNNGVGSSGPPGDPVSVENGGSCLAPVITPATFYDQANPDHPTGFTTTNDTVSDPNTGRMWQRHVDPTTFTTNPMDGNIAEVEAAMAFCEGLSLAGFDDWRLPSLNELMSILDSNEGHPSIDSTAFPDTPEDNNFWTSSREQWNELYFAVNFGIGGVVWGPDLGWDDIYARCVRTEIEIALPAERYTVHDDNSLLDNETGLVWEATTSETLYASPADAQAYCDRLNLAGCDGWRVPNAKEMTKLIEPEPTTPYTTLAPEYFTTGTAWIWSTSPSGGGFLAMAYQGGAIYPNIQADGAGVRCVVSR